MRKVPFVFFLALALLLISSAMVVADDQKETVIKPDDKLITQKDEVTVEKSNGETYTVKLKNMGKNSIVITVKDEKGQDVPVLRRVVRIPLFKDIEEGYWAKQAIELSSAAGLIGTARDTYFRPEDTIPREKFAKMIAQVVGVTPVTPKVVPAGDVPNDDAYLKYINYVVNTRKLIDLENGTFRPKENVTRAEAIVVFAKLERLTRNWNMSEPPFEDLPPRHRDAKWISAAKDAGLLKFAEDRGYLDADGALTNAEFASIIVKTKAGKRAVATLLNWDIGFSTTKAAK